MALIVAFDANGKTMTIKAGGVKLGNQYLICQATGGGEEATSSRVAMLPYDAILYIVNEKANVSAGATLPGDATDGVSEPTDAAILLGQEED